MSHSVLGDPSWLALCLVIYGIGSSYLKSDFYDSFDTPYDGKAMASMFSTRSPAEHKHLKTAVASKFSLTSLRNMEPLVDECSDIFLDAMRDLAGKPVNLGEWLQWYAFDVIGAITFRQRFGFMEKRQDVENMISGIETGLWYGALVGQVPGLHGFLLGQQWVMRLLDRVPALRAVHPVPKITRVKAEQEGRISDKVTLEECLKLPYLQAVMKEAMRMHPGVGFVLERVVPAQGDTLCGIDIPGGTVVGMNAWVIHHDRTVFGNDADVFRPERWLEAPPEQLRVMERCFLSFGAGSRSCIGKNISIMEMGKLVPRILRAFDIEWASTADDWTVETYWFSKQTNFIARFKQR
ncbi:FAD binding domain protein [Neofusicoccum parvum]|uniref:FAD binding domain protein n=1 Tax=Neofusicoccum parvum TaxID=310453 RepID=A0ACB5SDV0_9PEZI|nr:FAD binding domain protein [Neofusicoccum parvum]